MTDEQKIIWHCLADADAVAENAADRILAAAKEAIVRHGRFRIVLAGGRTPEAAYRLLANANADWRRWHIYFGDERCLPPAHRERNSTMAARIWLDHVAIPRRQIHVIPAELGPAEGARRYTDEIVGVLPFDLVILGLGEDGHTASLFPGHRPLMDRLVVPVTNAPKPPAERVSLSSFSLGQAEQVLVLVTGMEKHGAIQDWKAGRQLPISDIMPKNPLHVVLDDVAGT
jgi:6-phosphogluconolactonase